METFTKDQSGLQISNQEHHKEQSNNSSADLKDELYDNDELADLLHRYHAKFSNNVTTQATVEDREGVNGLLKNSLSVGSESESTVKVDDGVASAQHLTEAESIEKFSEDNSGPEQMQQENLSDMNHTLPDNSSSESTDDEEFAGLLQRCYPKYNSDDIAKQHGDDVIQASVGKADERRRQEADKSDAEHHNVCTLCGKTYSTRCCLKKHIKCVHVNIRKHHCPECEKSFNLITELRGHINRVHRISNCSLENCSSTEGQSLQSREQLSEELPANQLVTQDPLSENQRKESTSQLSADMESNEIMNEDHFQQNAKQKCPSDRNSAPLHVSVNELLGDKERYQCSECNKKFAQQSALKLHADTVHGGFKTHSCTECGRVFAGNVELQNHFNAVHLKKKLHPCPICGMTFSFPTYVKRHIDTIHNGYKPHQCYECGYSCSTKFDLNKHIKARHGDNAPPPAPVNQKRYPCHVCDKSFSRRGYVLKHIEAVHNRHRPFQCSQCGHNFSMKSNLSFHMKTQHGLVLSNAELNACCITKEGVHSTTVETCENNSDQDTNSMPYGEDSMDQSSESESVLPIGCERTNVLQERCESKDVLSKETENMKVLLKESESTHISPERCKNVNVLPREYEDTCVSPQQCETECTHVLPESENVVSGECERTYDLPKESESLKVLPSMNVFFSESENILLGGGESESRVKYGASRRSGMNFNPCGETSQSKHFTDSTDSLTDNNSALQSIKQEHLSEPNETSIDDLMSECSNDNDPIDLPQSRFPRLKSCNETSSCLLESVISEQLSENNTGTDIPNMTEEYDSESGNTPHHVSSNKLADQEVFSNLFQQSHSTPENDVQTTDEDGEVEQGTDDEREQADKSCSNQCNICFLCGNTFSSLRCLQRHIKCVHVNGRRFCCTLCDKSFKVSAELNRHINRMHRNDGKFHCTHCQKSFDMLSELNGHIKRVHKTSSHSFDEYNSVEDHQSQSQHESGDADSFILSGEPSINQSNVGNQQDFESTERSAESNNLVADVKEEDESDNETSDADSSVTQLTDAERRMAQDLCDTNQSEHNSASVNRCPLCRRVLCSFQNLKLHIQRVHLKEGIDTVQREQERRALKAQRMRELRRKRREDESEENREKRESEAQRKREFRQKKRQLETEEQRKERRALEAERRRMFRQIKREQETEEQARERRARNAEQQRISRQRRLEQEGEERERERRALEAQRRREMRSVQRLQATDEEDQERRELKAQQMRNSRQGLLRHETEEQAKKRREKEAQQAREYRRRRQERETEEEAEERRAARRVRWNRRRQELRMLAESCDRQWTNDSSESQWTESQGSMSQWSLEEVSKSEMNEEMPKSQETE